MAILVRTVSMVTQKPRDVMWKVFCIDSITLFWPLLRHLYPSPTTCPPSLTFSTFHLYVSLFHRSVRVCVWTVSCPPSANGRQSFIPTQTLTQDSRAAAAVQRSDRHISDRHTLGVSLSGHRLTGRSGLLLSYHVISLIRWSKYSVCVWPVEETAGRLCVCSKKMWEQKHTLVIRSQQLVCQSQVFFFHDRLPSATAVRFLCFLFPPCAVVSSYHEKKTWTPQNSYSTVPSSLQCLLESLKEIHASESSACSSMIRTAVLLDNVEMSSKQRKALDYVCINPLICQKKCHVLLSLVTLFAVCKLACSMWVSIFWPTIQQETWHMTGPLRKPQMILHCSLHACLQWAWLKMFCSIFEIKKNVNFVSGKLHLFTWQYF